MLQPARTKFRKVQRGRMKGKAMRGNTVAFGDFGLMALEPAWITANQIESARITLNRIVRKTGKVWIRIFPDRPYTKKPAETRMGSGKGAPEGFVAVVKPGRIIFEINGVDLATAKKAFALTSAKLPIDCKLVARDGAGGA